VITPFELDASWRDYWNLYQPAANALIAPINDNRCYHPRIRYVPDTSQQIMPPSGKIEYNFVVAPGSLIYAIGAGPSNQLPFTFQLTDIGIGHRLFQEPASTQSLPNAANAAGATSPFNYALLPAPWPVVGDGLFTVEIWGTAGLRYFVYLMAAEVYECA
jgi:hypothetical protein